MKWRSQFPISLMILLAALFSLHLIADVRDRDGFSWMDPAQYYEAAQRIATGAGSLTEFVVASSYPLILAQFLRLNDSIPFALATHVFWLLMLGSAIWLLCRRMGCATLAPLAFLLVMSAPAVLGLSRELYIEFPLTALVTLHYALWFNRDSYQGRSWYWPLFGILMGLGFSIKMTYPVFLAGPVAFDCLQLLRSSKEKQKFIDVLLAVVVPPLAVMLLLYLLAPSAFRYYLTIGNTAMPPMRLIGPTSPLTIFYLDQIAHNFLAWLTIPFIVLASWAWFATRNTAKSVFVLDLLFWIIIPLALFTLMPVREPRHIAPIMPALVLLMVIGIAEVRRSLLHKACITLTTLLAISQLFLSASQRRFSPYLLTRSIHAIPLQIALFEITQNPETFISSGQLDRNRWRYTRSILISGFPSNEALAIAWALIPGVVINVDDWDDPFVVWKEYAYEEFYDLALLTAFNLYNNRSGWRGRYRTLSRDQAIASADGILVLRAADEDVAARPGFQVHTTLDWSETARVDILKPIIRPTTSFRKQYVLQYLAENTSAVPEDLNAAWRSLQLDAFLRNERVPQEMPAPTASTNNIYYLSVYRSLQEQLDQAFDSWSFP